jgi:hypothetical protein
MSETTRNLNHKVVQQNKFMGTYTQIFYIKSQEEHHQNRTLREEYIALLEEHGVVYDEKYLL